MKEERERLVSEVNGAVTFTMEISDITASYEDKVFSFACFDVDRWTMLESYVDGLGKRDV